MFGRIEEIHKKQHLTAFNDFLTTAQQKGGINDIDSALEFLWEGYREGNPVDEGRICKCEESLGFALETLPIQVSDVLTVMNKRKKHLAQFNESGAF